MSQLLFVGFPDGSLRIGKVVSILKKEGRITYFVEGDSFFSHEEMDASAQRFAIASLISNHHVRASEVKASDLGIPYRTLMNWTRQLAEDGPGSFFVPRVGRGSTKLTPEKALQCAILLEAGGRIAAVAREVGVKDSALRKAVSRGRLPKLSPPGGQEEGQSTTKSERSSQDAQAAEGMGTACTRADERMAAALGLVENADPR